MASKQSNGDSNATRKNIAPHEAARSWLKKYHLMTSSEELTRPRYFCNRNSAYVKERSSHQLLYFRKQVHRMQRFYDLLAEVNHFVHQPPYLIEHLGDDNDTKNSGNASSSTPLNSNLHNEGKIINRTISTYTGKVCAVRRPRNLHPILPFQYRVAHCTFCNCNNATNCFISLLLVLYKPFKSYNTRTSQRAH